MDSIIATFSLPSGFSCPGAKECLSKANRATGKLTDGPDTQFRCFAASQEALYTNVRESRWNNFELLRKAGDIVKMALLIVESLPDKSPVVRIHVAGDFFSQDYFDAWLYVAMQQPERLFYAYTKSVPFWITRLDQIPKNFVLNASRGGRHDALIDKYGLKCAEVVFSEAEAAEKGLEIDHDDSHAYKGTESFALLLHGTQPPGSVASKALSALHAEGITGYSRKKTGISKRAVAA